MADQIANYLRKAYSDLVMIQAAQSGSKILPFCSVKNGVKGESVSFGYLGDADLVDKPSRYAPTPGQDVVHRLYWAALGAKHGGFGLDDTDSEAAFTDPKSDYVMIGSRMFGKAWDTKILEAAKADATYGATAGSTETWSTYTDRNAVSHVVAATGGSPNLDDVLMLGRIFADCDIEDDLIAVVSPQFIEKWVSVTEVKSADYNTIKALMNPQSDGSTFAGFTWYRSTKLPKSSTTRSCIFMQRGVMGVGFSVEQKIDIFRRQEKSMAWWAYFETCLGCVRRDPERVIEYTFTEA